MSLTFKLRCKILLVKLRLSIYHVVTNITDKLDLFAEKVLKPEVMYISVGDNKHGKVMQAIGPTGYFFGNRMMDVYLDAVDFQHEFGETKCTTYESIEQLKADNKCWESCGIVKVLLKPVKVDWVVKQDLFKNAVQYKPGKRKYNAKRRSKRNDSKSRGTF